MWRYSCRDTAIDLGGSMVRMHVENRGVVAREPSLLARSRSTGLILALGGRARELAMQDSDVRLVRPIRDGAPAEPEETEYLLRQLFRTHHKRRYMARPRMAVTVPSGITPVQYRAVQWSAYQAGARHLILVPTPIAAALGSGISLDGSEVAVVADIGADLTDVGIIAFGGMVSSHMVPVGGATMDREIMTLVRREHEVALSASAAESAKLAVAAVAPEERRSTRRVVVHGRDLATGLPRAVTLSSADVMRAISRQVRAIVEAVRTAIARCSPEISGDLMTAGLILTGGTAQLAGLDKLIHAELGLQTRIADEPGDAAVLGTAGFLRSAKSHAAVTYRSPRPHLLTSVPQH